MKQNPQQPTRDRLRTLLLLAALAAFLVFLHRRIHFDWRLVLTQLRHASPLPIALGVACIFCHVCLRSWRWTIFLAPTRPTPAFSLVSPQFVGFTAVALFGRLADLTRPWLISRRTGLTTASQIAVYTIERIFDLAAVAILFSAMLFFTPANGPHHAALARAGQLALAGTLGLAFITLIIRRAGPRPATLTRSALCGFSPTFANSAAGRILHFSQSLQSLGSLPNLLLALALSVFMWLLIAVAYLQAVHAFPLTPTLAALTLPAIAPLMAASMGGSLVQLPILGWFTQIALTSAAMHALYATPLEDATACATVLLAINTLSIIPVGLILSRTEHLDLRAVSNASRIAEPPSQSALS